jgi:CheY-like chemotaxis protein
VELAIDSSPRAEVSAAAHRLRSTLARLKAELELAEADGVAPPVQALIVGLREALASLTALEDAAFGLAPIQVLDDDERLAELTARSLRRLGYDAQSGRSLRSLRPREIVIFDLGLTAGLGAEEMALLKSARPIVVTGATDSAARAMAAALDAAEYLVKPVELDDLAAAVARRIGEGR